MTPTGPELFGRERELAAISAFVRRRQPSALVLEGEPGMGKTTLWRHGVNLAAAAGLRVLTSSPATSETQLSFAALADLLMPALAEVRELLPGPQRRALEVALLLDEPEGESAEQRTVFAATLSVLRLVSERGPVVVAIDDVQWLDEPTAEALAFAIRRLGEVPVSFLAARRIDGQMTQSRFDSALVQRHGEAVERIQVGRLVASSVHALILDRLDVSFPHRVVDRIHRTSAGNPFYALELARALARRPTLPDASEPLPVPDTLQQLVRDRLDALSPAAGDLLAVAATLYEPTLARLGAAGVSGALEEAVGAGILEYDGGERVRFSHPLLASAATSRLSPNARRRLHARLAPLVEGEERARHFALGANGPSAEGAQELEDAAHAAAARGAIRAAAELAEQAFLLTPPELVEAAQRRRLDAAGYQVRQGDMARARGHLEPLLEELPAGPTRAGVLLGLARLREQDAARALELCQQAIDEAGPRDVRAAKAHQLAAEMSMLSGDIPSAIEHARVACELAEAAGDRAVLIESLGTLCHYQTYTGAIEPGLLEHAVELERQQPRPSNNYSPREILGLRRMYADRLDEGRGLLEASYRTAEELGDELDRGALLIHLTQLECRAGNLARAEEHARETEVIHQQSAWQTPGARFTTALAGAHLGRVDRARAAAEDGAQLAARGGNQVFRVLNSWALGFLDLSLGNYAAAHAELEPLPGLIDSMGYRNPGVRPVHADAIEARIYVGADGAEPMIDDLAARATEFDHPTILGAAERCRGLLAARRGQSEGAVVHLEAALAHLERSPQPLERGRTLLALGSTLRRAKRRRGAREALVKALEIFDLIGAPLWAERAAEELARIPGRTASVGGLTVTERRVAELVAAGLSNKEVAAQLFVSVRTVEANLSSIYAKLGLRSRSELAGRLNQGLR